MKSNIEIAVMLCALFQMGALGMLFVAFWDYSH